MGCNKSKSQHGRSETDSSGEHRSPWELGQEAQPSYGENFEFNQNENSANGFHFDSGLSYHVNSEQQSSYGNSNENVTGNFGDTAPVYYNLNNGFNGVQYFSPNEYTGNINVYNQNINGPSLSGNSMYTGFSPEGLQGQFNQQQYHSQQHFHSTFNQDQVYSSFDNEFMMGPPPTPKSAWSYSEMPCFSRPLVRRRSFNDDYWTSHYQTAHNNTMARHNSLENIRPRYRGEYSRNRFSSVDNHYLFQNSSFGKEGYPRRSHQRQQNSRRQYQYRGLKRITCDDDSLNSNSAVSDKSESDNMPDTRPHVKRRLSSADDRDNKPTEISNDVDKRGKEENNYNNKTTHTNVEELNFDNDEPYDALNLLFFPDQWSSTTMKKTGLVDISLISPEGKAVQNYFSKSSDSKDFKLCITGISRIENLFMHSHYLLKKHEMESRNQHVDELYLYHGTKRKNLPSILEDNLNWRLYSENHRFGQGVSFSPLATYSSHYSDKTTTVKDMLLFKVLVSNSVGGTPDMKIPPITNDAVYDASIKDDTSVIVKYSDNEFYPLYKIIYKKVMRTS